MTRRRDYACSLRQQLFHRQISLSVIRADGKMIGPRYPLKVYLDYLKPRNRSLNGRSMIALLWRPVNIAKCRSTAKPQRFIMDNIHDVVLKVSFRKVV